GAAGPRHAALGHDPRARVRAAAAQRARQQPLIVAELVLAASVPARRVEDGHPRVRRGRDRLERELLVAALVRGEAHAAETDAELRGAEPSAPPGVDQPAARAVQATGSDASARKSGTGRP